MKVPPVILTILRVCAWMTLALVLLIGWRAWPYLPRNNPPQAVGLPTGWTPAGPDLALAWATPIVIEGYGLNRYMSGNWLMVDGKPTLIAISSPQQRQQGMINRIAEVEVQDAGDFRLVTFVEPAKPIGAANIDGQLWVLAHPKLKGEPYLALQIDPTTGDILTSESIAPKESERTGTLWNEEQLNLFAVPDLGGIVISPRDATLGLDSLLWRPGQPVSPIALTGILRNPRSASFLRDDGVWLMQGADETASVQATAGQLTFTNIGQHVTPVLPVLTIPKGWMEAMTTYRVDPNLVEPPIMIRQTYLSYEVMYPWQDLMPTSLRSSQDVAKLGKAFDAAIQRQILMGEMSRYQDATQFPVYLSQPLTLYTPTGSLTLADDAGTAAIDAAQNGWDALPVLHRLNPTQALVTQLMPWEGPGQSGTTPILRLGLLTTASTAIQWIGWTRFPPLQPETGPFMPHLCIYADGPLWTLTFDTQLAGTGWHDCFITTTTMPCPPGVTVDGTGWLISSRL